MLKLKIVSAEVATQQMRSRAGNNFESREQTAWLDMASGERRKVRVRLDRGQGAYPVGDYTVADESFVVGEYGDLGLGFSLKLEKLPAKVA